MNPPDQTTSEPLPTIDQNAVEEVKSPEKKHIVIPEQKAPVAELVDRLEEWLLQQPEYPLVFLAGRDQRKQAARLLAKRLFMLPARRTI